MSSCCSTPGPRQLFPRAVIGSIHRQSPCANWGCVVKGLKGLDIQHQMVSRGEESLPCGPSVLTGLISPLKSKTAERVSHYPSSIPTEHQTRLRVRVSDPPIGQKRPRRASKHCRLKPTNAEYTCTRCDSGELARSRVRGGERKSCKDTRYRRRLMS